MLMEFTRSPRLISYGLTTKHYCSQKGLQDKRLFEDKDNTITQEKMAEEKAVFQNNYMKY